FSDFSKKWNIATSIFGARDTEASRAADFYMFDSEARTSPATCPDRGKRYALAYLPRPKKRSFWSSLALSRIDFSWPTCAKARLMASRAAILSTHILIVGYLPGSMASNSKLRSHGHAAMSAMV